MPWLISKYILDFLDPIRTGSSRQGSRATVEGRVAVTRAYCSLQTFPFWLFVDRREALDIVEAEYRGQHFRVYPPFRSAPIHWLPMSAVRAEAIPTRRHVAALTTQRGFLRTASGFPVPPENPEDPEATWGAYTAFGDPPTDPPPDRFYPMDSLRIDAWWFGEETSSELQAFTLLLLEHLRAQTNQWWVGRSVAPFLKYERNTIEVSVNGRAVEKAFRLSTAIRTGRGDEIGISAGTWRTSIEAIAEGGTVPLHKLQLLDARYWAAAGDVKRSILDSCIACEDAVRLTFERLWPPEAGPFKAGRVMRGSGLPDYVSSDLHRVARRSLSDELPEDFNAIEDLWNVRGNAAHGSDAIYHRDGAVVVVDERRADELERAAEHCVAWLESL